MTEKEKMRSGKLYDANYDKELEAERLACKTLCQAYNQIPVQQVQEREAMLKKILGKTGAAVHIEPVFWCDYGYLTEVGENFYAIGPCCGFHTSGHPIDFARRNRGLEYAYPITVGDNVWFGAGVQVMPGVTIGSNVVIGGGSVVVKDIPDNVVAVGNPCRVIRQITEEDERRSWDR